MKLGVVIPTLNCRGYIERHVRALNQWLDLASEVVVVDSFSSDGTFEFLKSNLSHRNLRFFSTPPGLYASWNFGIQQIQSEFVSIATCGDTISREGVETLCAAISQLRCDVVISKPAFEDLEARALPPPVLPIDDVISSLKITEPRRLSILESLLFIALHANSAFTGSCASCMYKTETLQKFPFPTEFGAAGDGVWSTMHAADVSWGVIPNCISTFLMHPPMIGAVGRRSTLIRMDEILEQSMARWLENGVFSPEELNTIQWPELSSAVRNYFAFKTAFDRCRKSAFPWVLNPRSWGIRGRRNAERVKLSRIKDRFLKKVSINP